MQYSSVHLRSAVGRRSDAEVIPINARLTTYTTQSLNASALRPTSNTLPVLDSRSRRYRHLERSIEADQRRRLERERDEVHQREPIPDAHRMRCRYSRPNGSRSVGVRCAVGVAHGRNRSETHFTLQRKRSLRHAAQPSTLQLHRQGCNHRCVTSAKLKRATRSLRLLATLQPSVTA